MMPKRISRVFMNLYFVELFYGGARIVIRDKQ